ncbi:MoaD/ThiS family protein [Marinomonas dokdonensis]|uniref:MoaD/ThiS family protein n=1 Tax=Marinomonas dokdonensis TaxID=328224 RepID=UPI0040557D50
MSKLKVVFFASLRESLGIAETELEILQDMTVAQLQSLLAKKMPDGELLLQSGIQASIDLEFAREADVVTVETKEVAFFPPVTGG